MVGIILDIILVVLAIAMIVLHIKKGFFASLFGFMKSIISAVLAYFLSKPVGRLISSMFMNNAITNSVRESLTKSAAGENDSFFNYVNIHKNASFFYDKLLVKYGLETENLDEQFANITSADEATIEDMSTNIGSAFAYFLSSMIALVLLFIIFSIILYFIIKALNVATKLPGINVLNKLLGAVLGVAWAVIWITIIGSVIVVLNSYFPDKISLTLVNDSIILRMFYNMGLLKIIPNMLIS